MDVVDANNLQLCRICITNSNCTQMISIFGEDSLWKKITTLADVKIEKDDTLPQQVCIACAKNAISACLFKKKCEDADNFFRQQLLIRKIEGKSASTAQLGGVGNDVITLSEEEVSQSDIPQPPPPPPSAARLLPTQVHSSNERYSNKGSDNDNVGVEDDDEDDGEIKSENTGGKPSPPTFDFNSIRLMHEYMQQHLNKINGSHSAGSMSDANGDDDEPLPLIPEIELLTPADDASSNAMDANTMGNGGVGGQMRGYQCTVCYQIFDMKQILKHHMQSVHGTSGPVYECSNCKKTYFYKRFLEKHVRRGRCVKKRRNQTRPMQCSDCHVLFPTGHHLGWHKRTGCPSRAAKMPLQQLFKQNIVQYNNFPKRIGIRKPENAIYLHNRKLAMANNKRKGRTRIKLDAKKIALAKQLILREATTTVIANELNISRTFAWRLRKSLVNGVSLHERVIDPTNDEPADANELQGSHEQQLILEEQQQRQEQVQQQQQLQNNETVIKSEQMDSDDEMDEEEEEKLNNIRNSMHMARGRNSAEINEQDNGIANAGEADDGDDDDDDSHDDDDDDDDEDDHDDHVENINKDNNMLQDTKKSINGDRHHRHQQFMQSQLEHTRVHAEHVAELSDGDESDGDGQDGGNNYKQSANEQQQHFKNNMQPMLNGFPAAVAAAIHQLPVNLSIKPIASMQNLETNNTSGQLKKPRKPNVFIDDEKYAMAKMLVAQNSSTMEIARQLNVSQMTAWKVRDAIVKGIPLSYRSKREFRLSGSMQLQPDNNIQQTTTITQRRVLTAPPTPSPPPLPPLLPLQQHQPHKQQLQPPQHSIQFQQSVIQHLSAAATQQQHLVVERQRPASSSSSSAITSTPITSNAPKIVNPRRRLKAAEREMRDKEITREILEMIKEDSNIQYWKVSARLAEKGYPISPSSVCQKLKSMGIHRRWKPGDKPPMLDMEQLKANGVGVVGLGSASNASSVDESGYVGEQQFDMGGAHFLSAFSR